MTNTECGGGTNFHDGFSEKSVSILQFNILALWGDYDEDDDDDVDTDNDGVDANDDVDAYDGNGVIHHNGTYKIGYCYGATVGCIILLLISIFLLIFKPEKDAITNERKNEGEEMEACN